MVHLLNEVESGRPKAPAEIRGVVEALAGLLYPDLIAEDHELVARRIEEKMDIVIAPPAVVQKDYEAWLGARSATTDPYYWDRYRQQLVQQGLPPRVVAELGETTDRILDLTQDPLKPGSWDRRGLVMGNVQSGKTANYTGLICKAADAGFKVVIVIAGIHNNLRNQTQARIDEGFIGGHREQSAAGVKYTRAGVGLLDARRMPVHFTSKNKDFSKATASAVGVALTDLNEPAVFVIKKNATTLKHLLEWLREFNAQGSGRIAAPLLLIDDEADNASINVSGNPDEVSKINRLIREILDLFDRSAYVGYTATPFANIFIDPDTDQAMLGEDLFPRSFIVSLDPPSDYLGATRVFITEDGRFLRSIDDNEELLPIKHKKDLAVQEIPESLKRALHAFVVTRAIRTFRGQGSAHSSMLVNASRFVDVQGRLRAALVEELDVIKQAIRINSGLAESKALKDPSVAALHDVFEHEFGALEATWSDLQPLLLDAASPIKVVEVNSRSAGTLNYRDHLRSGLHVVAVGGFSLSRGLTLEGLSTTYFLRNSIMYDTLLQMGRWFGYRPGYEDLCRIWLPIEARSWYAHVAESVEELRDDLRAMERVNGTPEDFGLKVRRHPDTLIVTARNKMGRAENIRVEIGLGGRLVETTVMVDADRETNLAATQRLAERLLELGIPLTQDNRWPNGYFAGEVPVEVVLDFLSRYRGNAKMPIAQPELVSKYVSSQGSRLGRWDIYVPSIQEKEAALHPVLANVQVNCQTRNSPVLDGPFIHVTSRARVAGRGVERVGLSAERADGAERLYRERREIADGSANTNYPDKAYRDVRERPLLVLHLLSMKLSEDGVATGPWAAWSMSFPKWDEDERTVSYQVNRVWVRENLGWEEEALDEGDENNGE
ncbi:MAG: Z1 domain-containing protein [Candidatus Nanopelagicales bacterium]